MLLRITRRGTWTARAAEQDTEQDPAGEQRGVGETHRPHARSGQHFDDPRSNRLRNASHKVRIGSARNQMPLTGQSSAASVQTHARWTQVLFGALAENKEARDTAHMQRACPELSLFATNATRAEHDAGRILIVGSLRWSLCSF